MGSLGFWHKSINLITTGASVFGSRERAAAFPAEVTKPLGGLHTSRCPGNPCGTSPDLQQKLSERQCCQRCLVGWVTSAGGMWALGLVNSRNGSLVNSRNAPHPPPPPPSPSTLRPGPCAGDAPFWNTPAGSGTFWNASIDSPASIDVLVSVIAPRIASSYAARSGEAGISGAGRA